MYSIFLNIKSFFYFSLDTIVFRVFHSKSYIKRDIVIIRTDAIGDFILWLDAATAIKEYYSRQKITLICNETVASFAEVCGLFDEVISLNTKNFANDILYRYKTLFYLRKLNPRQVINPLYSRQYYFLTSEAIIRFIKSDFKIGYDSEFRSNWQVRLSSRWYDKLVPADNERKMELVRNADFVRSLYSINFVAGVPTINKKILSSKLVDELYYILFPSAGSAYRCWPTQNFAVAAEYIYNKTGMVGLICGGQDEFDLGEQIINSASAKLENWIGKTPNLIDLISLISDAQFLVSNETSAVHIAAATHTESICILGGGHFNRFAPYQIEKATDTPLPRCIYYKMSCFNCQWNCIYDVTPGAPVPCVSQIPVAMVLNEVDKILTNIRMGKKNSSTE